jgi:hypothetical protein
MPALIQGTKTYTKLNCDYKIPKTNMHALLDIIEKKYQVDKPTAENIICEAIICR